MNRSVALTYSAVASQGCLDTAAIKGLTTSMIVGNETNYFADQNKVLHDALEVAFNAIGNPDAINYWTAHKGGVIHPTGTSSTVERDAVCCDDSNVISAALGTTCSAGNNVSRRLQAPVATPQHTHCARVVTTTTRNLQAVDGAASCTAPPASGRRLQSVVTKTCPVNTNDHLQCFTNATPDVACPKVQVTVNHLRRLQATTGVTVTSDNAGVDLTSKYSAVTGLDQPTASTMVGDSTQTSAAGLMKLALLAMLAFLLN